MTTSYSCHCSSTIMMKLLIDIPIESLSLNLSTYKPLKSHKSALPIFLSEKLMSNL